MVEYYLHLQKKIRMSTQISPMYWGCDPQAVSSLTTAPAPVSVTGTVTSVGQRFTTSAEDVLSLGDWVFVAAQSAVRRVIALESSTTGLLDSAFSSDLTTATVTKVTKNSLAGVWAIDIMVTGATSVIKGLTFPQNATIRIGVPTDAESTLPALIQPVVIDGSSGKTCNVFINTKKSA